MSLFGTTRNVAFFSDTNLACCLLFAMTMTTNGRMDDVLILVSCSRRGTMRTIRADGEKARKFRASLATRCVPHHVATRTSTLRRPKITGRFTSCQMTNAFESTMTAIGESQYAPASEGVTALHCELRCTTILNSARTVIAYHFGWVLSNTLENDLPNIAIKRGSPILFVSRFHNCQLLKVNSLFFRRI